MSTIRTSALGPVTGSNTASVVDPQTPSGGIARIDTLVSFPAVTASGNTITFAGIPSWVRRITINLSNVTKSGSTYGLAAQIGSGSLASSGYVHSASYVYASGYASGTYTNGFGSAFSNSTSINSGSYIISNVGGNVWSCVNIMMVNQGSTYYTNHGAGSVTLAGTLDRVALTYFTDSFAGGTVNCFYE